VVLCFLVALLKVQVAASMKVYIFFVRDNIRGKAVQYLDEEL
jgi:hypothetical protein